VAQWHFDEFEKRYMVKETPLVSVVLLSYERPHLLKNALESLVGQSYKNLKIIVVNNKGDSSDRIAEIVNEYSKIKLIRNERNLGFSGGMNRGIDEASGKYVFLTEDDIIIEKNCITYLVDYMENNTSTGFASGIMYNKNNGTIRCAGGELSLGTVYSQKFYGAGEKDSGQFSLSFNVTYIPGAMMFCRQEIMKKLGGFRQEFFMYYEDAELCLRVLKSGYKITIIPQAKTFHYDPPDVNLSEEMRFYGLRNLFSIYILHAPFFTFLVFIIRYGFINLFKFGWQERKDFLILLKVWFWFIKRMPSLFIERYQYENTSYQQFSS